MYWIVLAINLVSKSNVYGLGVLGLMLFNHSLGGKQSGYEILKIAMEKGDLDSSLAISDIIKASDAQKSREILESNVSKNHIRSQYNLALLLINGSENTARGLELLHKAADSGHANSCAQLGMLYKKGEIIQRDYNLAFKYLTRASEHNHIVALFELGSLYQEEFGDQKSNLLKQFQCYLKAADGGLSVAQHNVACIYLQGLNVDGVQVVEKEVWKALEYFKLAAEQGFVPSCVNLGKMYFEGTFVDCDLDLAEGYFKRAQVHGVDDPDDTCKNFLGRIKEARVS